MKNFLFVGLVLLGLSSFAAPSLTLRPVKLKFTENHVMIYKNIAKLKSGHLRALAFGVLTPEEKKAVWEYKFSIYFTRYQNDQKKSAFIYKLYKDFSNFSYAPGEIEKFRSYASEKWRQVFNEDSNVLGSELDAFNLIFQVVPIKVSEMPTKQNEKFSLIYPDCECIMGQPGGCFYTEPDGRVVFGICLSQKCKEDPSGGACGFFGTSPCDGYGCGF